MSFEQAIVEKYSVVVERLEGDDRCALEGCVVATSEKFPNGYFIIKPHRVDYLKSLFKDKYKFHEPMLNDEAKKFASDPVAEAKPEAPLVEEKPAEVAGANESKPYVGKVFKTGKN